MGDRCSELITTVARSLQRSEARRSGLGKLPRFTPLFKAQPFENLERIPKSKAVFPSL
ncbi:hypothetical protein HAX54_021047, partial [Datura stramonium]|nr:hypothetical protein [Datura stramonium]